MRRFAIKGAAFLTSFLALTTGLEASTAVWLTAPTQTVVEGLKYRDLRAPGKAHPNIVIGTSHAVYGVEPALLEAPGFPVYNFGFRNATPIYYERWYELIFRRDGVRVVLIQPSSTTGATSTSVAPGGSPGSSRATCGASACPGRSTVPGHTASSDRRSPRGDDA